MLATPLQLATMAATVANGGTVWQPQVVKRIESLQGDLLWAPEPEKLQDSHWSAANLRAVRDALEAVVNEPGGTAFRNRLAEVPYAGKTGTAQVVGRKGDKMVNSSVYEFQDHALFIAYAPAVAPEIAVAVVVEHGGHGGSTAAPIAKAMIEAYFGIVREPPPLVPVVADAAAPAPAPVVDGVAAETPPAEEDIDRTPLPSGVTVPGAVAPAEPGDPAPPPYLRPAGD